MQDIQEDDNTGIDAAEPVTEPVASADTAADEAGGNAAESAEASVANDAEASTAENAAEGAAAPAGPKGPKQGEMPFGLMYGKAITKLPDDLYIPPDALEVFLEAFQGPLDLLLYLIKRQNLDILVIPVAQITPQYLQYVELMKAMNLELAAEYLVMAA